MTICERPSTGGGVDTLLPTNFLLALPRFGLFVPGPIIVIIKIILLQKISDYYYYYY